MRRNIENKLALLETKLNPELSENDKVIIYFVEEGIPKELLNDSVPHIFIPDNSRDPEFESIQREKLKLAIERARTRKKAQCIY